MNIRIFLSGRILLSAAVMLALPMSFLAAEAPGTEALRSITVSGQGSVSGQPDIAKIQIGVETFKADVGNATTENRQRIEKVIQTLLSHGIEQRDMQTSSYNINFERRYPEQPTDTGVEGNYRVTNMLSVTVRDLKQIGEIIDAAILAGANQLWGVQFSVSNAAQFERFARIKAVENAREKAEQLATAAGVALGSVLSISETGGSPGLPMPMNFNRTENSGPVATGELTFTVNVEMSYGIE